MKYYPPMEERADKYVGHPIEIDESVNTSCSRVAFIRGAESERELLTGWHGIDEIPEMGKWILMKIIGNMDNLVFYFPQVYFDGVFQNPEHIGQKLVGWRYIHEFEQ